MVFPLLLQILAVQNNQGFSDFYVSGVSEVACIHKIKVNGNTPIPLE